MDVVWTLPENSRTHRLKISSRLENPGLTLRELCGTASDHLAGDYASMLLTSHNGIHVCAQHVIHFKDAYLLPAARRRIDIPKTQARATADNKRGPRRRR